MSAAFLRKYAVGSGADIYVPIIKRGVVDYAVGADWTPAAGDVKVSIDGGAAANIGTLPTAIVMGNTAYWLFVLSNGELSGKKIAVTVSDSATKAVEDQMFDIETYGNASAMYIQDLAAANYNANFAQLLGTAPTEGAGGRLAAAFTKFFDKASPTGTINSIPDAVAGTTGGLFIAGTNAATTITTALTTTFTGSLTGSVASVTAAVDLSTTALAAIWNRLTSALTTVGSVGKLIVDYLDAAISSRSTFAGGAVASVTGAVGSVTGNVGGNVLGGVYQDIGGSIQGNILGSVLGSVDSVVTPVTVGTNSDKTGYGLSATALTAINAEVVDVINTDTSAEPGAGAPPATASLRRKVDDLHVAWRNKKTNDGTNTHLFADDGSTEIMKQPVSEAAGTVTKGEWVAP